MTNSFSSPTGVIGAPVLTEGLWRAYQDRQFFSRENPEVVNIPFCVVGHLYSTHTASVDDIIDKPIDGIYSTTAHNAGLSAIHYVGGYGGLLLCDWLYQQGANLNKQDFSGMTALHHAVLNRRQDVISMLLCLDADPNVADTVGSFTAKQLAEALAAYYPDINVYSVIASMFSSPETQE